MGAVQPQLPFTDGLIRTGRFDACVVALADAHYSRETHGSPQCAPPGELVLLRNAAGTVAFGWVKSKYKRADGEEGVCCFLFCKEGGARRASEIILEAERFAVERWGATRAFTYVNPKKVRHKRDPGRCFIKAGWRKVRVNKKGLIVFEKFLS